MSVRVMKGLLEGMIACLLLGVAVAIPVGFVLWWLALFAIVAALPFVIVGKVLAGLLGG
jgi:hypothetical protein